VALKIFESAQKSAWAGRDFVVGALNAQVHELGAKLGATSGRLQVVSTELRGDPIAASIAPVVDGTQSAVERAARYLRESDIERISVDLETFSRSRPITATLIATLVGFSASRAVKASSARRSDASGSQTS
jgi:hypothetical protein